LTQVPSPALFAPDARGAPQLLEILHRLMSETSTGTRFDSTGRIGSPSISANTRHVRAMWYRGINPVDSGLHDTISTRCLGLHVSDRCGESHPCSLIFILHVASRRRLPNSDCSLPFHTPPSIFDKTHWFITAAPPDPNSSQQQKATPNRKDTSDDPPEPGSFATIWSPFILAVLIAQLCRS